jgi:hypothetical protein
MFLKIFNALLTVVTFSHTHEPDDNSTIGPQFDTPNKYNQNLVFNSRWYQKFPENSGQKAQSNDYEDVDNDDNESQRI